MHGDSNGESNDYSEDDSRYSLPESSFKSPAIITGIPVSVIMRAPSRQNLKKLGFHEEKNNNVKKRRALIPVISCSSAEEEEEEYEEVPKFLSKVHEKYPPALLPQLESHSKPDKVFKSASTRFSRMDFFGDDEKIVKKKKMEDERSLRTYSKDPVTSSSTERSTSTACEWSLIRDQYHFLPTLVSPTPIGYMSCLTSLSSGCTSSSCCSLDDYRDDSRDNFLSFLPSNNFMSTYYFSDKESGVNQSPPRQSQKREQVVWSTSTSSTGSQSCLDRQQLRTDLFCPTTKTPIERKRAYQCNFTGCTKTYYKSSHLKAHFRSHTGKNLFFLTFRHTLQLSSN